MVTSISVCSASGVAGQGSCPSGTADTHRPVLGPDGSPINSYVDNLISDEHASVFAPQTLGNNADYLFFVASGSPLNHDPGALVLSGGNGPTGNGQWTFDFPAADGYGAYPRGFGAVLLPPIATKTCPTPLNGDVTQQDQTFDLNYASPGSILRDPTGEPGRMVMIYESVNHCVGNPGGNVNGKAYLSASIATSLDYGKTWPTYRGVPGSFAFVRLPRNNQSEGPNQPFAAFGDAVCMGNDCSSTPPANYGRYQAITPPTTLNSLMIAGQTLTQDVGAGEVSGFLDDASATPAKYVYLLYGGLKIARAPFNGGAPLAFKKWDGYAFAADGMGGDDAAIPLGGDFHNCGGPAQVGFGASISYVEESRQYLLLFICDSPGEPAGGVNTGSRGAAWMWATSDDLFNQTRWSVPEQVEGSWSLFDTIIDPTDATKCSSYKGYYPTLMSLEHQPEHVGVTGYAFYLWGCQQGGPGRMYSSRKFKISITAGPGGK
jgi:hypothetical protein